MPRTYPRGAFIAKSLQRLFSALIHPKRHTQKWPCSLVWRYTGRGDTLSVALFLLRGVYFGTTKIFGRGVSGQPRIAPGRPSERTRSPPPRPGSGDRPPRFRTRQLGPESTRNKGSCYATTYKATARAHCFLVTRRQQHKETGLPSKYLLGAREGVRISRNSPDEQDYTSSMWCSHCPSHAMPGKTREHTHKHTHAQTLEEKHKGRLLRSLHGY